LNLDGCIPVVVAFDEPLEAEIDQHRRIHDEFFGVTLFSAANANRDMPRRKRKVSGISSRSGPAAAAIPSYSTARETFKLGQYPLDQSLDFAALKSIF